MTRHRCEAELGHLRPFGWVLLLAAAGCRHVEEPSTTAVPEFLGEYSGIYAGLDDRPGVPDGTIVIHLGDRALISPFTSPDGGAPRLSWFANIVDLEPPDPDTGGRDTVVGEGALLVPLRDFVGAGTRCAYTPPAAPGDPPAMTFTEFVSRQLTCQGAGCDLTCEFVSPLDPEDTLTGTCLDGIDSPVGPGELGDWCLYEGVTVAGRLSSSSYTLYFDSAAVMPPTRVSVECPDDPDHDWVTCFRYEKQCEFDSRLAGVYHLTLTHDPDASTGPPSSTPSELDVAVAIADNVRAAAIFDGERVFFGSFDPFALTLALDDGRSPDDSQVRFRDPNVATTIEVDIRESATAEQVQLEGTWTETTSAGPVIVYRLSGVRSSGSEVGRACVDAPACEQVPPVCPGGYAEPPGTQLLLETDLSATGCPFTRCTRIISRESLCPGASLDCCIDTGGSAGAGPVLDCSSPTLSSFAYRGMNVATALFDMRVSCRDGSESCPPSESCFDVSCAAASQLGFENVSFVDLACVDPGASGALLMTVDPGGGANLLACPTQGAYCTTFPPVCPLGDDLPLPSSVEPVQTDPCFLEVCWRTVPYTPSILCPGETYDEECSGDEVSVPVLDDALGCLRFACETSRSQLDGGLCAGRPGTVLPPPSTLDPYGLDVADLFGCPLYRPHVP